MNADLSNDKTLLHKQDMQGRLDEILDKYKVIGVALKPWEVSERGQMPVTLPQDDLKAALTHLIEAYTEDRVRRTRMKAYHEGYLDGLDRKPPQTTTKLQGD